MSRGTLAVDSIGVRGLLTVSLPLFFSIFNENFCYVFDKYLLTHYSQDALNGVCCAYVTLSIFSFALMGLTSICQIFAAKEDVSGNPRMCGVSTWQMIWVSLLSTPVLAFVTFLFWKVQYFGADSPPETMQYFIAFMPAIPLYGMNAAISSFFIATGQTKLAAKSQFLGQLAYLLLDPLLIYSGLGVVGAAFACGLGQLIQFCFLFWKFSRPALREKYGTMEWRWSIESMRSQMKMGLPYALSILTDRFGWSLFFVMMLEYGQIHLTLMTLFWILTTFTSFIGEGLCRGVALFTSRLLALGAESQVQKVIRASLVILVSFATGFIFLSTLFPSATVSVISTLFLSDEDMVVSVPYILTTVRLLAVYVVFEGLGYVMGAILLSLEETISLLVFRSVYVWIGAVVPLLLMNRLMIERPIFGVFFCILPNVFYLALCLLWFRYRMARGKVLDLAPVLAKEKAKEPALLEIAA